MYKQEIFNKVVTHLANQGRRSILNDSERPSDSCAYRGEYGAKCAIGCLIPDNLYTEKLEGKVVRDDRVLRTLKEAGVLNPDKDLRLERMLTDLQHVHDQQPVNQWETSFRDIAAKYLLKMPTVDWSKCNSSKEV